MKVRIGLSGFGYMGKIHARNLAKKRVCSFAGVYDTDPLKIHEAENVGYKTFKSLEDLAKASDALLFATPTPLHRKNVQEGLELDKDILLEKPSSTSVRDDEEMEKLMKKYGRIVAVNYPERFNKAVNRARGIDFSKVFLTLSLRINPPPEYRRIDSGLIFDLPVHDIDVLYYWTGLEPVVNYCKIEKNKITMSLRVGNIESNIWAIRISGIDYMYRHVEVFGMKRYFHLDYGQQTIVIGKRSPLSDLQPKDFAQYLLLHRNIEENMPVAFTEPIPRVHKRFVESVGLGKVLEPLCSLEESKVTTKTVERAIKLAKRD